MLFVAVCEDEQFMLDELSEAVTGYFETRGQAYQLSRFTSAEQLLLTQSDFDIILMDIKLIGMDGMAAAKELRRRGKACEIIFITALRDEVFRAFDVDALHFLVKPVKNAVLARTLDKAAERLKREENGWLTVLKDHSVRRVAFGDILYCEARNHQISLCLKGGEKILYYQKIADLTPLLDERFYRCHRSFIVNLDMVLSLENGMAVMANKDAVPVSRDKKKDMAGRLLAYFRKEMLA